MKTDKKYAALKCKKRDKMGIKEPHKKQKIGGIDPRKML
jgi:hypothetical protein